MWAVVASGASLTKEQVELVRQAKADGKLKGVIAVSNVGLDMMPDADALVSHDSKWWYNNKNALKFAGRKFCRFTLGGTEQFEPRLTNACNSGLMAMEVAWKVFGAEKIILLGVDMKGSHYFGNHPLPLKNSGVFDFKRHLNQFNYWNGCEVINCTPDSALTKFPFQELKDVLK